MSAGPRVRAGSQLRAGQPFCPAARAQPGRTGASARLRDPSGPRPRTDSAPVGLPDSRGRQPAPPDPARSLLPSRVSAAHSPQLRGLLAPQATSGFSSPGHGARDLRRRRACACALLWAYGAAAAGPSFAGCSALCRPRSPRGWS